MPGGRVSNGGYCLAVSASRSRERSARTLLVASCRGSRDRVRGQRRRRRRRRLARNSIRLENSIKEILDRRDGHLTETRKVQEVTRTPRNGTRVDYTG